MSRMLMLQELLYNYPRFGNMVCHWVFEDCFVLPLAVFDPTSSSSEHDRILVGSCHIALIPQPYKKTYYSPPEVKAEFRAKWKNIVDGVLKLRTCLHPTRGSPQGGYRSLISESFANPNLSGGTDET